METPDNNLRKKGEEVSRRDLIKKVAKGALSLGGIVVAGAAGGIGARNAEALFEKPPESIAQNPLQEIVDERYAIFSQAIDSGDSESVLLAIFLVKKYEKELAEIANFHTALQGELEKLKHNSAASAGVQNELTFLEQRHREVVNQIDTLKRDLVVKYLENEVHLPQEGEKIKAGPEQEGRYTNI